MPRSSGLRQGLGVVVPALLVANVLGYAVFVGVGRLLGPTEFASFAAFWGLLFAFGGMTAPLEQETARLVASGVPVTERRLYVGPVVVGLVLSAALVLGYPVTVGRVLSDSWLLLGLVVLAGLGFCVQSTIRGARLGSGALRPYGLLIVGEAGLRTVALLAVVAAGSARLLTCAVAVVTGSFAWLGAARFRFRPSDGPRPALPSLLRKLGSLVLAAGFTSAVVTGFPALASAFAPQDERRELGVLLAALTITRIPLLLMGPVQALLVPDLVRRQASGGAAAVRRILRLVLLAAGSAAAAVSLLMLVAGGRLMTLVYGDEYVIGNRTLAVMTAGAGLVALQLLLASALLALGRHDGVVACWVACFATLVLVLAAPVDPFATRAVAALVAGPAVGVTVALLWLLICAGSVDAGASAALDTERIRRP